jgi:hypothetical protein
MRCGALLALACMLVRGSSCDGANVLGAPIPWRLDVADLHGVPVGVERLRGHATLVTFSTRETEARSIRLGQEAGSRFGGRPGYLSLTIVNTSQLSVFLRPLAASAVTAAEKEAVRTALARQHARGHSAVTEDDVRRHVIFIHDTDGRVWRTLGVDPEAKALHVGVIDAAANLVYVTHDPIDESELFDTIERELAKLERR